MGVAISRDRFEEADFHRFRARLRDNLQALESLLERPGFGRGDASIGAELEMFLVDAGGRPVPLNHTVVQAAADDRFTLELDRFNLECNSQPRRLAGTPFSQLGGELDETVARVRQIAASHASDVVLIGILPTLEQADFDASAMSDVPRYRALDRALRNQRGGPFHFEIDGLDPLTVDWNHVTFEGANTSLQLHLRVSPEDFSSTYNAAQLATGPALAASGNSPTFLGRRLWQETRIALFKQAVDDRRRRDRGEALPRVCFGSRWLERGALEAFEDAVRRHDPLLPVVHDECPLALTRRGDVPGLHELRLHSSTVWTWNRPVYDPGGHLRIEMRALPAGPTVIDMLANSAFLIGLTLSLRREARSPRLPFELAHDNFYRAAQHGLDARLHWTSGGEPIRIAARDLIAELCPLALAGLTEAGVASSEAEELIDVFAQRAATGKTGSRWQLAQLEKLGGGRPSPASLRRMTNDYREHSRGGDPVHRWPDPAVSR